MYDFNHEIELKDQIHQKLNELISKDATALGRESDLGKQINFINAVPTIERILGYFKDLSDVSLDGLTINKLDSLLQLINSIQALFSRVEKFTLTQANPVQAKDQLIDQIAAQVEPTADFLMPIISFATRRGTDFRALEQNARKTAQEMEAIKKEILDFVKGVRKEAISILDKVRTAASEVGVAQHAIHFEREAKMHNTLSRYWLGAAVVVLIGIIIYTIWAFYLPQDILVTMKTPQVIHHAVSRIFIFSLLTFVLVWVGRNYMAHRHNSVVNTHRHNSLKTFETFIKAPTDNETKNAVILRTTESIFAQQISGYMTKEKEAPGSNRIVEIFKQISHDEEA